MSDDDDKNIVPGDLVNSRNTAARHAPMIKVIDADNYLQVDYTYYTAREDHGVFGLVVSRLTQRELVEGRDGKRLEPIFLLRPETMGWYFLEAFKVVERATP